MAAPGAAAAHGRVRARRAAEEPARACRRSTRSRTRSRAAPSPARSRSSADDAARPPQAAIADLARRRSPRGQMHEPIDGRRSPATARSPRRRSRSPARAPTASRTHALDDAARRDPAGHGRQGPRRRVRGHGRHGRVDGLQRRDEAAPRRSCSASSSLFAFLLLLVAFRSIVVAAEGDPAEPALGGAAYGVLVAVFQWGWGENMLDFNSQRRHRLLAADVPVRDPVRALDGLPRVHPQPGPRGLRPRQSHRRRPSSTASDDRRRRDQRRGRDGRACSASSPRCPSST